MQRTVVELDLLPAMRTSFKLVNSVNAKRMTDMKKRT